ncbi:MAG: alanine racemase [Bacteroidetes bacterium]|nr:MAG: alanine racemase [Bacteroidota bacterium]
MNDLRHEPSDHPATVASIDLAALRNNVRLFQDAAPGIKLMGVVKANAYGHGAIPVSETVLSEGMQSLAVATIAEGIELRTGGITSPILVFGAPRPSTVSLYHSYRLDATITGLSAIDLFDSVLETRIHLHLDTGMGRVGIQCAELTEALQRIDAKSNLKLVGVSTHFSSTRGPDSAFAQEQWNKFETSVRSLKIRPEEVHVASSTAIFTVPSGIEPGFVTSARVGVGLYGLLDLPPDIADPGFLPVMTFESEITHVKTVDAGTPISYNRTWVAPRRTRIATVAAGYADGFPRNLSNTGSVFVRGQSFPIVGTVCMDMFMIDLGPLTEESSPEAEKRSVMPGESVILFGMGGNSVVDVAKKSKTISYEIVCGVSGRVPRIFTR